MRRLRLLYPFLYVVLPILTVVTRNPGGSTLADLGVLLGATLTGCALVFVLVAVALRRGWSDDLVPLVVLAGIAWFYSYQGIRSLHRLARSGPAPAVVTAVAVVALLALTVLGLRWLAGRPGLLAKVTTFFAITGLFLVGWSGMRIAADQIAARRALRESSLARDLSAPVANQAVAPAAAQSTARDIYLIILDEYANSSVLRERFGFDNRPFEDSLRALGFTIPRMIRSNYVHTLLSLPSLLNFSHLTRLADELGTHNTDPTLPDYLVENNRTAMFLKARGYRFLFFPSQWWISTRHNRNADWEFRLWSDLDPGRQATRSDLRRAFLSTTPLALLHKNDAYDAEHVKRTLAAIERVPAWKQRTFALAHILNPHYPYVFDATCHTLRARPNSSWEHGRRDAYINQLRCLNSLVLRTVTALLQQSSPAPVILLLGDHGSNSLQYSSAPTAEAVSAAQARERFGAFGAFFLPGAAGGLLADSVTLVNVVPSVLNHYFNARIPLAPNTLYMSLEQTPYLFVEVNPASLAPPS